MARSDNFFARAVDNVARWLNWFKPDSDCSFSQNSKSYMVFDSPSFFLFFKLDESMNQSIKVNVTVQVTANKQTVKAVLKPIIMPGIPGPRKKSSQCSDRPIISQFSIVHNFHIWRNEKKIQIEKFEIF